MARIEAVPVLLMLDVKLDEAVFFWHDLSASLRYIVRVCALSKYRYSHRWKEMFTSIKCLDLANSLGVRMFGLMSSTASSHNLSLSFGSIHSTKCVFTFNPSGSFQCVFTPPQLSSL